MQWSGPTDGVSDCTPYFNKTIMNMLAGTGSGTGAPAPGGTQRLDTILEFPTGVFCFRSMPVTLPQMNIQGQGKLSTVFIKQFNGGSFFRQSGAQGNGLIIERLAVLADPGYLPGNFCTLAGLTGSLYQPDNFQLRELYVSQSGAITGSSPPGGGLWQNGILVDGLTRTHPQGIRIGVIENCEIFNCISSGVYIRNGVGVRMTGGGCYPGAAAVQYPNGTGIFVTGGAALAISTATWSGNVATVTTAAPHALVAGDTFDSKGNTPSGWNGEFVVVSAPSPTQITFALTPNPGAISVKGTISNPYWNSNACQFTDVINNCVLNISRSSFGSYKGGVIGSLATDDSSRWRIDTTCVGAAANNLVDSTVDLNQPS